MKHLKHLLIASTVTALCACNNTKESPVSLQWEMVKNGAAPGFYESSFTITNTSTKPLESDWEIYYTQLSPRQVKANEDSPVIIEMINAGYYKIAPSESWTPLAPGDSIKISYLNQGIFTQTLFTPKSPFFVTNNGTQISIPLSIAPFDRKEQWTVQGRIAPSYPDGEKVYADNQALETTYKIQTYDMLPSLKEVTPREGTIKVSGDNTYNYVTRGIDGQLTSYKGDYVQTRMSCLNSGDIDELMFTSELSKKFRTSTLRVGLNEWYYDIDYTSNTTMYDQSVPADGGYAVRLYDANKRNDYFYDFNKNASEYYKGHENKLALYITHDWDITPKLNVYYGGRIEWQTLSGENAAAAQCLPFDASAVVDVEFRGDVPVVCDIERKLVLMAFVIL